MPQSLVKNYIHIIYSTKGRQPLIDRSISEELFAYIGGICKNLECNPIVVGGYLDHVHLLCTLSQKVALMKLLEETKSHSSKWVKTKGNSYTNFYWQNGYGAFSVNPVDVDVVIKYIQNQEEHHTRKIFQQEYRSFLGRYKVDYDERYVWD
ncbi:MAG: IS200/IS605 family transposase [Cyclobacteriaceae bacterium]